MSTFFNEKPRVVAWILAALACTGCGSTSRDADETQNAGTGGGAASAGASSGGASSGGATSVGGVASVGGASAGAPGVSGAGGASDGGAAGSSAGEGGGAGAMIIVCTMRQGLAALPADPETRSTIQGTNGTFTDECDADGNLIEYTCPTENRCGPDGMDCAPYPTGAVGSSTIDCNGECHDGVCD